MIEYKTGNLFVSQADAFAHGCNTVGKMNAGIANQFKQHFPEMFRDYKDRCRKGIFLPGDAYIFYNEEKPHVINLATQGQGSAQISYIESSLDNLRNIVLCDRVESIAMPRIGSGLGKLDWNIIKEIIERYLRDLELKVEIWGLK